MVGLDINLDDALSIVQQAIGILNRVKATGAEPVATEPDTVVFNTPATLPTFWFATLLTAVEDCARERLDCDVCVCELLGASGPLLVSEIAVTLQRSARTGTSHRDRVAVLPPRAEQLAGMSVEDAAGRVSRWASDIALSQRQHQVLLNDDCHYEIPVSGGVDEYNTTQSRRLFGTFSVRQEPLFRSNVRLTLSNVGDSDVVSPRLRTSRDRGWFDVDQLLDYVLDGRTAHADIALALHWHFCRGDIRTHNHRARVGAVAPPLEAAPTANDFYERANPINGCASYYASSCSHVSAMMVTAARRAGIPARVLNFTPAGVLTNRHASAELFYDGGWHLFDPAVGCYFVRWDNETVASAADIRSDPTLVTRTHVEGPAALLYHEAFWYEMLFEYDYALSVLAVESNSPGIDFILRPGESIQYRWAHNGLFHFGDKESTWPEWDRPVIPPRLANGSFVYEPDFTSDEAFRTALQAENIGASQQGLVLGEAGYPGTVILKVDSPYPIVGGSVRAEGEAIAAGELSIAIATPSGAWIEPRTEAKAEAMRVDLSECFDTVRGPAVRSYFVRLRLHERSHAAVRAVRIESLIQMNETMLPGLRAGTNFVEFAHDSGGPVQLRALHEWVEDLGAVAPEVPASPINPKDGARLPLHDLRYLEWAGTDDCAGHHIVLCREDTSLPISPNFDRMFFGGATCWPIPSGWLVGGRRYFWSVRSMSRDGVWSEWSPRWHFATSD